LKILYKSRYTISLIIIRSLRFTLKIVTARENPEYSTINNVTESKFFLYNFQFLINNKNVLVMFKQWIEHFIFKTFYAFY